ncbi:uncharacterized protein LOC119662051 isoform X1 [Teleopsis dalmanni]|uniref:uncharacterized protein LOC119662051 isoform X1 n=1 Tax=Teleopsis dalmanni TaxID=139649 RepID=UPI0018CD7760|nr:uncharacterized protein LOC119662051 isoform X1 [Teleopsis dalmanni]
MRRSKTSKVSTEVGGEVTDGCSNGVSSMRINAGAVFERGDGDSSHQGRISIGAGEHLGVNVQHEVQKVVSVKDDEQGRINVKADKQVGVSAEHVDQEGASVVGDEQGRMIVENEDLVRPSREHINEARLKKRRVLQSGSSKPTLCWIHTLISIILIIILYLT